MTKLRVFGLIAVLVTAASIAAASAQTQILRGHDRKGPADLELTYTKWIAPGFPNLAGVVGGDIVGKFGGAVYERTVNGNLVHLDAIYIVIAPNPAKSFTAHVEGTEDLTTLKAVLDGRVVDGYLKHAHVHVEFDVINCTQASSGTCFQGTISVTRTQD
ncbi:MAG: hypothetical protein C5B48_12945 [Candidatus Rokuibacteriota bacterium]|nr:MAG: hypothetical protein C5B48_12945 [Candidatus Rokubacteria bacterium]